MNYQTSAWAIVIFIAFVSFVLWIAYYYARRTKTAKGYFAAGGTVHWAVNGIAFAGDYLSAASFLGICGMIAVFGYDGFLYSIGYLAGWIVALFVVAEPLKRLGKYTFADALDAKFDSKGIQLAAALSTLVVSVFYLIPQMVGAGVLVTPLLGLPHFWGVVMVGSIVIIIVASAGMASTTYVQFLKGGLLIVFSLSLVITLLSRGFTTTPDHGGDKSYHEFTTVPFVLLSDGTLQVDDPAYRVQDNWQRSPYAEKNLVKLTRDGRDTVWSLNREEGVLEETLYVTHLADGSILYNGAPKAEERFFQVGHMKEIKLNGKTVDKTGPLDPITYLATLKDSTVVRWGTAKITDGADQVTVYYQTLSKGSDILRPGLKFKVGGSLAENLNFISLMLALFCGTAALPHILIRYYTVPSPACARKSTIVAIAAIGFFYVLTLFMGLGAMTSGVLDLTDNNMSAPLLAKSFGIFLFAIISAIAFATVLGTVSGLIVAASGAVAHDLMDRFLGIKMTEHQKVLSGKLAAIAIGIVAMALGVKYKGMNVSYLVGWAFAVAASANLPAIIMLLFWKRTTAQGITASIIVGMVSAVGLILLSPEMYTELYNLPPERAIIGIDSPAIISIPLSFLTLVVVSLMTKKRAVPTEIMAPAILPAVPLPVRQAAALPTAMPMPAMHGDGHGNGLDHLSREELVHLIQELRAEVDRLKETSGASHS
jgi:cation/acetate symporter